MSKSTTLFMAAVFFGGIAVLASIASWGRSPAQGGVAKQPAAVGRLVKRLRTGFLREKAKEYGIRLWDNDFDRRIGAVDFFHDLRAADVMLLALKDAPFDTRDYVVKAVDDVTPCEDLEVTRQLLGELKDTTYLVSGGTEQQFDCIDYRITLVKVLQRITCLKLPKPQLHRFTPRIQRLMIADAEVPKIMAAVKEWLEMRSRLDQFKHARATSSPAS